MNPRVPLSALLCLAAVVGCDSPLNPVAPSGTVLTLTAVPTRIGLTGEGSSLTVTGVQPAGNPINPGTQITLSSSLGVIRPRGSNCADAAVVTIVEADNRGQAFALLCGDGRAGEATVTATLTSAGSGGEGGGGAGSNMATATVQIGETDSSRPSLLVSANPSVVPVGGESVITLIGRAADGTPVASGSRIRLTADLGTLTCSAAYRCPGESSDPCNAVCTDVRGEAEATFTAGERSGNAEVTAILGTSEPAMVTIDINAALDSLQLELSRTSIPRNSMGEDVTLTAILNDALGTPLSGVLVRFSTGRGRLSQISVPSNAQGVATTTLTVTDIDVQDIPENGTFEVQASATSEGETRSATRRITILGSP